MTTLSCADRDIVTLRDGAMVDGTYADGSPVTASFPDVDVVLLNGLRATCTGDYARLIANACIAALRD